MSYASFYDGILRPVLDSVNHYGNRNAFYINERFYTYAELGTCISRICFALENTFHGNSKVGLVINDDLETYASIIALWLEGNSYVPLHPGWPLERCLDICNQVELDLVLDSSEKSRYLNNSVIKTSALLDCLDIIEPKENIPDDELAYTLFTSGLLPKNTAVSPTFIPTSITTSSYSSL